MFYNEISTKVKQEGGLQMKNIWRKLLSTLLVLILCVTYTGIQALAVNGNSIANPRLADETSSTSTVWCSSPNELQEVLFPQNDAIVPSANACIDFVCYIYRYTSIGC